MKVVIDTTGTAKHDSDYDIFVVHSNHLDRKKISEIIWEVGFENDILLIGSYIPEKLFSDTKIKHSFFIQNVMNQGIPL
ncbi:MAG: nucleotidyltransferase domain-containing protein [Leptospiraceae bacterium]|nr:nucleotidyltransferase domain-containing protein [Leptospiraceae bacterium]MCP5495846.1 nucleotidyltransferase domain-containing protein [Leptospiraceae bacterium]